MHTRETLRQEIRQILRNRLFIVVSNREPYIHRHTENGIVCTRPASGMALALDPVSCVPNDEMAVEMRGAHE